MPPNAANASVKCLIKTFLLLGVLIFIVYSNSFQASWHLDDYRTIVDNPHIKISDLRLNTLWQSLHAHPDNGAYDSDALYRPIPSLTFAFNWYLGKENVIGYHLVNVCIHFLTACFLYLAVRYLLDSPNLRNRSFGGEHFIALLSAALWAVNPIQTQAITYIVQRMAAMAAMFYLMGIAFYLKGRLSEGTLKSRSKYFIGAFAAFVMATLSKENAVMWPAAIVLVETVFFQDLSDPRRRKRFIGALLGSVIIVGLISFFIFMNGDMNAITQMYGNRPFTLTERFLTQFRALLFYLSQLFYPIPQRLSIEHDFVISTAWLQPWATLPAILIVTGIIGWCIFQTKKRPVISFALLFFFLNHLIESSILGLELVFEHRNYLPSAFLFFPVAVFINKHLQLVQRRRKSMFAVLTAFTTMLLVCFGVGTFSRNSAWSNERTLWEDALAKAPHSSRPYHNLAWGYYQKIGNQRKSIELYSEALQRRLHHRLGEQQLLANIAGIYYTQRNYAEAVRRWQAALMLFPKHENIRYHLANGLTKMADYEAALAQLNELIAQRPDHPAYRSLKGYVLLKLKRYPEARVQLEVALSQEPGDHTARINQGACLNLMGHYRAADRSLRQANRGSPQSIMALLWLIDTNLKKGNRIAADRYLNRVVGDSALNRLDNLLQTQSEDYFVLFPRSEILYQAIARTLRETSMEMARLVTSDPDAMVTARKSGFKSNTKAKILEDEP